MTNQLVQTILQIIVGFLGAPLLAGFIKKVKARMQRRQGPSIFQPYFDLRKLFGKTMTVSMVTSWIFRLAPFLEFGVAVLLLGAIPGPWLAGAAGMDIIMVLYLWGLARFFSALAGLDAGSAFGGMGSSREMTIAAMIEPGMILTLLLVGYKAATLNIARLLQWADANQGWFFSPFYFFAVGAFLILLIAETGRIPVDNPDTHLELTMIHEGMILEYSGPYLALINMAFWIRQYLFYAIFVHLFLPGGFAGRAIWVYGANLAWFLLKIGALALVVSLIESGFAKMRLVKVSRLLWLAFALGLMGLLTIVF